MRDVPEGNVRADNHCNVRADHERREDRHDHVPSFHRRRQHAAIGHGSVAAADREPAISSRTVKPSSPAQDVSIIVFSDRNIATGSS
jgi:hypothetical protein